MKHLAWLSCGLVFVLTPALPGQTPAPRGPELALNSYTTGSQDNVMISTDAEGNFVAAWESEASLVARRFDADGVALTGEITVTPDGNQARTLSEPNGDFSVVWEQDGFIRLQKFNSSGSAVGGELQVNAEAGAINPSVARGSAGHFIVVWSSPDGDGRGVEARRFATDGNPVGDDFQVNSITTGAQYIYGKQQVGVGADGSFVVVWDDDSGADGDSYSVQARFFASDGLPIGDDLQINAYTTGEQIAGSVAALADGHFLITWSDDSGFDGDASGVLARRFESTGTAVGQAFQVNSYTTGRTNWPNIAADPSGPFLISYSPFGQDGDSWGVFGQRFAVDATPIGREFQINTFTGAQQLRPSAAPAPGGGFVVAFDSGNVVSSPDGDFKAVRARILEIPLFEDGFESGDTQAWSLQEP